MKSLFPVSLALILSACAQVVVKPLVSPGQEGVRYFQPEPYLLVTNVLDDAGNPTSQTTYQLIYLPNFCKGYAITESTGIGSVEMSPTLADGWNLTALNAKVDSKTAETLTALASLIPSIAALSKGAPAAKNLTVAPLLYRLVFNSETGHFVGLQSLEDKKDSAKTDCARS